MGTIYGSTGNQYIESKIEWSESGVNIANNTSVVTATLYYRRTNSGYTTHGTWSGSVTIDGTTTSGSASLSIGTSWVAALTATKTITHNADGTRSAYISASGSISGTSLSSTSVGGYATLSTIPRASTLSHDGIILGVQGKITVYSHSDSFRHNVDVTLKGKTYRLATNITGGDCNFLVPLSEFAGLITDSARGIGNYTLYTYTGANGSLVGTSSNGIAFDVPKNADTIPAVTLDVSITNPQASLTGSEKLIANYTRITATATSRAKASASIKTNQILYNVQTVNGLTANFTAASDAAEITFTATDSRGFTNAVKKTYPVINWFNPSIIVASSKIAADGKLNVSITGNVFTGSFGAVSNTCTVQIRHRAVGNAWSQWSNASVTADSNTYTASFAESGYDYKAQYGLQARVVDKLATTETQEIILRSEPVFDWGKNDFAIHVPVTFQGKTLLDLLYPIGSIYISTESTEPSVLLGGTWERIKDRFLLAAGDTYAAGSTGGSATHTLTVGEMPPHDGHLFANNYAAIATANPIGGGGNSNRMLDANSNAWLTYGDRARGWWVDGREVYPAGVTRGGGTSFSIMPPHLVVYVWKRTA